MNTNLLELLHVNPDRYRAALGTTDLVSLLGPSRVLLAGAPDVQEALRAWKDIAPEQLPLLAADPREYDPLGVAGDHAVPGEVAWILKNAAILALAKGDLQP